MSLFNNDHGEPQFVKEDSSAYQLLDRLRHRLTSCSEDERPRIERDIRLQEAGLRGEEQIVFELKNSHLRLCVLRDLSLQHDGLKAQIDFLVLLPYVTVVIECKNLVGNITINQSGDFIREFGEGRSSRKEGIYSPITQNIRHLELMKAIRLSDRSAFGRLLQRPFFDSNNKSIVVLANPRTILKDSSAPKEIREQIVRGDRLISCLKDLNRQGKERGNGKRGIKEIRSAAEYWLGKHAGGSMSCEDKSDSLSASEPAAVDIDKPRDESPCGSKADFSTGEAKTQGDQVDMVVCPKCGSIMIRRTVTRGERKGKELWGCSRFPKCRGLINID